VVPIKIPDVGATVDRMTLVRWLVEVGVEIARGQKIAEIETDKSVIELESVAAGVLLRKYAEEGGEVSTGEIIAYVGEAMEAVPEAASIEPDGHRTEAVAPAVPSREISKPRIAPMLRNLARQKGVDVDQVVGTGKDGTVTRQDIVAAAERLGSSR